MSVSPAVHEILEATAERLETVGWSEGGSGTFCVNSGRFTPSAQLCLLDSLGLQTGAYVTDVESSLGYEGRHAIIQEITDVVIPALYRTIMDMPGLTADERRTLTFPSPCSDISSADDPFFGAVAWYNDFACTSGEHAAEIIRKTAKEL